jgi:hypothetical protein
MLLRRSLISLSLLTLMALPALGQDQSSLASASQSSQPQSSQSQTSSASPTSSSSTAPDQGAAPANTPSSTQPSSPPQDPAPTPPQTPDSSASSNAAGSTPAQTPVQEPDDSKVKHDGSKNDVDAIGNRKVGGRGMGDWYSLETEIKMGKQYSMQVENSVKMVQDPVVTEYVNRIGQNLVRNSDAQVPFTIKVIDSDEINAFALPGGFFYVNSGLILAADEEAELAGVMAHEISHVAARHGMRQMTRANWANIGTHSINLRRWRHWLCRV